MTEFLFGEWLHRILLCDDVGGGGEFGSARMTGSFTKSYVST